MKRLALLFLTGTLLLTACAAGEKTAASEAASNAPTVAADSAAVARTATVSDSPAADAAADSAGTAATAAAATGTTMAAPAASTSAAAADSDIQAPSDADAQLQLIADSSDQWLADSGSGEYWYAVTDLDRDGNLEVISASLQGSGLYTWFSVYEVNGDRTGLDLLPDTLGQGESGPDLIVDSAPAVEKDGIIYYYFEDTLRLSPAEHLVTKMTLSLEDGKAVVRPLASAHTGPELDENGEPKEDSYIEEYFNGEEEKISSEEFDALTALPDGCETIGFGWIDLADGVSVEALRDSYNAFGPAADL